MKIMTKSERKIVFAVLFSVLFGIGWVKNAIKLSDCYAKEPCRAETIYLLGVITPISIVTGWLDLEK